MTDMMTPPPEMPPAQPEVAGSEAMPPGAPESPVAGMDTALGIEQPTAPSEPISEETNKPAGMPDEGAEEQLADESEIPTGPKEHEKGMVGDIKKIADDYVIPMSAPAADEWAIFLKGKDTKPFKDYATQVAMGLYPSFTLQLQLGLPTAVLLDPYVQIAQQVLGPIMSQPNWNDPKWAQALQGGIDPKTNRPVPMPLDQWKQTLMSDPKHGWDKTPEAHDRANEFVDQMKKEFGASGEAE